MMYRYVDELIADIQSLTGYRDAREVFLDLVDLSYICLAKLATHDAKVGDALEADYMRIVKARDKEYIRAMPKLFAKLSLALNLDMVDILGMVATRMNLLDIGIGQVFTPPAVSHCMAQIAAHDLKSKLDKRGFITMMEPAVGGGSMVLAFAKAMSELGHEPSKSLYVECTDINQKAFKMAYIQLALCSIPARVINGNTLTLERWEVRLTPAAIPFLNKYGKEIYGEMT